MASLNVGWKFEGFGLTLLEASAAGLPVIGTRDCGAEDAVIEGETGLLVAQSDLEHELASRDPATCWLTRRWRRGWALPGAPMPARRRGITSPRR